MTTIKKEVEIKKSTNNKKAEKPAKIGFEGKPFEIIDVEGVKYAVIQLGEKVEKSGKKAAKIPCVEGNANRNGKVVLQTEIAGDLYSVYPVTVYIDKKPEPEKQAGPVKSANNLQNLCDTLRKNMEVLPKNSKAYKEAQKKLAELTEQLVSMA